MNLSHHDRSQLDALLDLLAGGILAGAERSQLNALLRSSPEAQQAYLDYFSVHAALAFHYSVEPTATGGVQPLTSASVNPQSAELPLPTGRPQPGSLPAPPQPDCARPAPIEGWSWFLGNASPRLLAAVVLTGLGAYFGFLLVGVIWQRAHQSESSSQSAVAVGGQEVARLTSADDCQWKSPAAAPAAGDPLESRPLQLMSGLIEIQFASGASVVLEGPAEFIPQSSERGLLKQGRLLAHVPLHARGFTILTPSAEVIDLGTDFGVEVDSQGATDLHVIRGRVELKSTATTPTATPAPRKQQVVAGHAVRVSAGGDAASPIPLDRRRFEAARATAARSLPAAAARRAAPGALSRDPLPEGQPIWLGNLFDDFAFTGVSLAAAIRSDEFRAKAEGASLGVDRVLYAGSPIKQIAPGVSFDAMNLGWQDIAVPGGHVANDAWTDANIFVDENGPRGGIRTQGKPMGYNEPRIEEGIGQHANALITFDLDAIRAAGGLAGQALEFRCDRAGINDACLGDPRGEPASVHLAAIVSGAEGIRQVLVDGRPAEIAEHDHIWRVTQAIGEPLRADGRFVEFRVSLAADAKWLTLLATSAGDGYIGDHAVWSGARVEMAR